MREAMLDYIALARHIGLYQCHELKSISSPIRFALQRLSAGHKSFGAQALVCFIAYITLIVSFGRLTLTSLPPLPERD
jgi:hypothetical protein